VSLDDIRNHFSSVFQRLRRATGSAWRAQQVTRTGWHSQRGEGRFKAILFTAVFVAFIFVAIKIVPPYVTEYELTDKMQEQARFAVVNRMSEDQIRNAIVKEIDDLGIPAKKEDVKVTASMQVVTISVDYTVPVDLIFYHVDLHFTPTTENKSLT
jgi:uncharacterized membrane protein